MHDHKKKISKNESTVHKTSIKVPFMSSSEHTKVQLDCTFISIIESCIASKGLRLLFARFGCEVSL